MNGCQVSDYYDYVRVVDDLKIFRNSREWTSDVRVLRRLSSCRRFEDLKIILTVKEVREV